MGKGQADNSWVLPPEFPSGTSIELATKASHLTPEMLELLQQLMAYSSLFRNWSRGRQPPTHGSRRR